tara:strand:- start:6076 stop:6936 length:861 start_codon:yes stop_codon:yes gene_type:complete
MSEDQGSVLTGNPIEETPAPVVEAAVGETTLTQSDWVSDEYKEVVEAKGWKSADDVMKGYVNLERQIGADKVVLPKEGDDIAEWEGWEKLGTPETSEGYDLKAPEGYDAYAENMSNWYREAAHKVKLPAAQAQQLHDSYVQHIMQMQENAALEQKRQVEDWGNQIKREYGQALDERVGLAHRAMRAFGSDELRTLMDETGLGNHPEVVKAFVKIGSELSSGQQFKDAEETGRFGVTPEAAKEQIAQIRAHPGLYDTSHPENKILNEKLTRMTELAHGDDVLFTAGR